eukprot:gene7349-8562_t
MTTHQIHLATNHGYIVRWFVSQLDSGREETRLFVRKLMMAMLHLNESGELSIREYSQKSKSNRMKCKLWRTLCALTHDTGAMSSSEHLKEVSETMWRILEIKNHANVRYLIQLFIVNILVRTGDPELVVGALVGKLEIVNYDYQVSASIIIIAASYLHHILNTHFSDPEITPASRPLVPLVISLFKSIIPWSTDFHHAVRTSTQLAIHAIISQNNNTLLRKLREKQTLFIASDDPLKQSLADNVLTSQRGSGMDAEDDEENATNGDDDEDDVLGQGLALDHAIIPMSLLEVSKRVIKDFQSSFTANQRDAVSTTDKAIDDIDFQKRIVPWETLAMLEDVAAEVESSDPKSRPRQDMIVVGTFIENTPNIAGLIRTAEIFNMAEVAIPNIKLLVDPQFQRVSVAAEKWVPITEVTRMNLLAYLVAKKEAGYSILGVEQTSASKCLSTFVFPQKCLLLLGQEQNGIPAEFLDIVDYCIEIPQLGVTRSLNVHVSASIVIWEYSQQQLLASKATQQ